MARVRRRRLRVRGGGGAVGRRMEPRRSLVAPPRSTRVPQRVPGHARLRILRENYETTANGSKLVFKKLRWKLG